MTPDYCPKCRQNGVIATVNGPTCSHAPKKENWFPEWWTAATEARRLLWLESLQTPKKN